MPYIATTYWLIATVAKHAVLAQSFTSFCKIFLHIFFILLTQQCVSSVMCQINCQQEDILDALTYSLQRLNRAFSSRLITKAHKYTHRHKSLSFPCYKFDSCSSWSFHSISPSVRDINFGGTYALIYLPPPHIIWGTFTTAFYTANKNKFIEH